MDSCKPISTLENMSNQQFDNMLAKSLAQAKRGEGESNDEVFEKILAELGKEKN